jgi:uncharacterized membrane protein
MPDAIFQGLEALTQGLEIVGAGALVLGFVIATGHWFLGIRRTGVVLAVEQYRKALGRVVLIGLEILVAATIIKTVALDPTFENMGLLAIMIAIRTALGWSMVLEMNGIWPWQKKA